MRLAKCMYNLVKKDDYSGFYSGCGVFSTTGLVPPMSQANDNVFGRLFGLEFDACHPESDAAVRAIRAISPFEFASSFQFGSELVQQLADPANVHLLDGGIPARTSRAIFGAVHDRLVLLRRDSFEVVDLSPLAQQPATEVP